MRATVLTLLFISAIARPAFAGPCTGVEAQLARLSAKLTLNDVGGAQTMLAPIQISHPDCPEILLAEGRIEAAKGNAQAAADFYVQYTDLESQDARGFAYFGRLFLDQRDYPKADALSAAAMERNANDPASLALRGQILAMTNRHLSWARPVLSATYGEGLYSARQIARGLRREVVFIGGPTML